MTDDGVWTELQRPPGVSGELANRLEVVRSRPKLGEWVEVKRFSSSSGRKDATTRNWRDFTYYRLTSAEAAVLDLLDGERTVGEVVVEHLRWSGQLDLVAIVDLVHALREGNFLIA